MINLGIFLRKFYNLSWTNAVGKIFEEPRSQNIFLNTIILTSILNCIFIQYRNLILKDRRLISFTCGDIIHMNCYFHDTFMKWL